MDRLTVSGPVGPVSNGPLDVRRATGRSVLRGWRSWVCQNVRRATSHYGAKRTRTAFAVLFLALNVVAWPAQANSGVPMVAVFLPPLWLALIPIIAVESWVLVRLLAVSPIQAAKGSAIGNVLSTLVGVPFMWMVLATMQLSVAGGALGLATPAARVYAVTVQAPWLIPYEEHLTWMIPAALAVLAIPAYALSVLIEWLALLPFVSLDNRRGALGAVAIANLASYVLLAVLFFVALQSQEMLRPVFAAFDPVTSWFMESVFRLAQTLHGTGKQ